MRIFSFGVLGLGKAVGCPYGLQVPDLHVWARLHKPDMRGSERKFRCPHGCAKLHLTAHESCEHVTSTVHLQLADNGATMLISMIIVATRGKPSLDFELRTKRTN